MPSAAADVADLEARIGHGEVARFAATLRALGCADGEPLGVAVSGGPDSCALLLLAAASRPGLVTAATVDHGLRPEAIEEGRAVAALCKRLSIPHTILPVTVDRAGGGLQASARTSRYAALAGWCTGGWLLVGHQRDDVAEAMLMRLGRGAGVRGLARMAERSRIGAGRVELLRPLLDWSRAELLGVCVRGGVAPADDPSNHDMRFDRARARALLARTPWLPGEQLARSARNLAEADAALEYFACQAWAERADETTGLDTIVVDAGDLPHDTRRRFAERIIAALTGQQSSREGLETFLALLADSRPATLAGVKAEPGPPWRFTLAPPRR